MSEPETIMINNIKYIREDSVQKPISGNRHVIVLDRGWIFAGDVVIENGTLTATNVVNVVRWSSIGFNGMISNPNSDNVKIDKSDNPLVCPMASVLFMIPVRSDWGLF